MNCHGIINCPKTPGLQFYRVIHFDYSDPITVSENPGFILRITILSNARIKKTGSFDLTKIPAGGARLFINLEVGFDCKVKLFDKYFFEYTDIILLIKHQHRFFIVDRVNGPK